MDIAQYIHMKLLGVTVEKTTVKINIDKIWGGNKNRVIEDKPKFIKMKMFSSLGKANGNN